MEALCSSENIVTTRTQCVRTHRNTARVSNETDRHNLLAVFLEVQVVFVIVLYVCLAHESVLQSLSYVHFLYSLLHVSFQTQVKQEIEGQDSQ